VSPEVVAPAIRPAIRIAGLTKRYGGVEAVRGIDLTVEAGEIFGLIGPDGAGKTSTFQVLGGVMEASGGEAELLGRPARQARSYVGYLTQVFSLYPDLSVEENLRYVGELRLVPRPEIERRGHRYLEMFDMDRFRDRLASRLSGGRRSRERRRVGGGGGSARARSRTCGLKDRRPPVWRPSRRASAVGAAPRDGGCGAPAPGTYARLTNGLRAAGAAGAPAPVRLAGCAGGVWVDAVLLPPGCSHVISPVEKMPFTFRSKSSGFVAASRAVSYVTSSSR